MQYAENTAVKVMSKMMQLRKYAKKRGTPGPKNASSLLS